MSAEMKTIPPIEVPRFRSHKVVEALRITGIEPTAEDGTVGILVTNPAGEASRVETAPGWQLKHLPDVGGYLVNYADGYLSYSPATAFEEGYTLISEGAVAEVVDPDATTWLERLIAEEVDLEYRLRKLTDFIENSPTFAGLSDPERDQLLRQRVAMQAYHAILVERLDPAAPAAPPVEQDASDEHQEGTEPEI